MMRRIPRLVLLGSGLLLSGTDQAQATGTCTSYTTGTQVGTITDTGVNEASGVAASQQNPGIYWTHNDSGNSGDLIALAEDGSVVARYSVSNATNIDWEDIALGPCPEACACIFLADTGDNLHFRARKTIYRLPEPVIGIDEGQTQDAEPLEFTYPNDDKWDAETLLVDPRSGDMYVVNKDYDNPVAKVFLYPANATNNPAALVQVGEINFAGLTSTVATGGDVTADAGRVVVRTLSHALEFGVPAGASLSAAFATTPKVVALPSSSQGEAIGYTADGMALMTLSENVPSPVYKVSCSNGTPVTAPEPELGTACEPASGCRVAAPAILVGQGHRGTFSTALVFSTALLAILGRRQRKRS